MKISIHDLNPSKTVRIAGDEHWLKRLYQDFPLPEDTGAGRAPRLTGEVTLTLEEAGSVSVGGHLDYAPFVPCGRCDRPLPWPLSLTVSARYLPADVNPAPKEKNLSRSDLDAYYLEDGEVDLEQVVNDTVQTALPSTPLLVDEEKDECRVCHASLADDRIYIGSPDDGSGKKKGDEESPKESPFAALKGLKLPN